MKKKVEERREKRKKSRRWRGERRDDGTRAGKRLELFYIDIEVDVNGEKDEMGSMLIEDQRL
jgi:hypothetical protein